MTQPTLSVREIQPPDIESILAYWLGSDPDFLIGMGVDLQKIPSKADWSAMLSKQLSLPYDKKPSYCTIWEVDGAAVGHCNVNTIEFGEEAFMHLHMWNAGIRQRGIGTQLVKMSLPWFFDNLQLKRLYCEPYALNPAPNKTLERVGFTFVRQYVGIPGSLSFEQPVNRWELRYEDFLRLKYA